MSQTEPMLEPTPQDTPQAAPSSAPQGLGLLSEPPTQTLEGQQAPSANSDWVNLFSEENRAKNYLKEFKSADDLLKSYENQRSLIGKRLEDFSPEQLESYRAKLGVPDEAAAYKLTLSEDIKTDNLNESWFRQTMRDANIPQKEAQVLYGKYAELVNNQVQSA